MPVYKFSHHVLAVLVHLAHTAVMGIFHELCWHDRGHFRFLRAYLNTPPFAYILYAAVHWRTVYSPYVEYAAVAVNSPYNIFRIGAARHGRCLCASRYSTSDCVARRYPDFRWFSQVALTSVDIFHAVTATEEHVWHGWHNLVPLVAVVGGAANTKSAVDDFVKWKRIKSLACVIDSSERSDYLRFMFTLPYVRYSLFEFLAALR